MLRIKNNKLDNKKILSRVGIQLLAFIIFIVSARLGWSTPTPYNEKPGALVTETGLIWDFQLAEKFNNKKGRTIFTMDFCFSGAFVEELSADSLSYAVSACDWDEFSYGGFGKEFMNASKTETLHDSFVTASNNHLDEQLAQEGGALGSATLNYLNGDQAILFSADDDGGSLENDFWSDLTTARSTLKERATLPWPDSDTAKGEPISVYYGDGTPPGGAPAWLEGEASKENLFSAIDDVFADSTFTDTSNLFIYLNDHGTNTDVVKSRHDGTRYDYQVTTSLWRGWTDDNPYGINKVRHKIFDTDLSHYLNITTPKDEWGIRIVDDWMEWYSTSPDDRDTWLVSGLEYDFGFDHIGDAMKVRWEDWCSGDSDPFDWGEPDGTPWGRGNVVYGQSQFGAADPMQWPGWDNGGDGWVWAPTVVPEPSTIVLMGLAMLGFVFLRRRN